ncbi:FtsB family cell division protein [Enemella evansiae]|uniref:FtsB family cell division protein n=1 Tax=Enemella evansiae TaxID=2016499 RepID=UPI000C010D94|nr:septum formation initiator family protein [Enemella evansiae]PFG68265.1 cell division protein FtsB [Propionibacteriaceae bacterium ES.041]TDO86386.1 cell division protein FtsB [Enemella evansiae]
MPDKPRTRRAGAGPGRGKPRSRTGSRASRTRDTAAPVTERLETRTGAPAEPAAEDGRQFRRFGLTRRAVALFVVLAVLVLSYASSLRIYLDTERQNAENQQAIQRSQARIDDLNNQLQRWDDPDYVRAQARERLGWVVPGETGYRVIGPDGQPVGTRIESQPRDPKKPPEATWWQKMWGSVGAADQPAPPPVPPSAKPPITDGTRTPTPSRTPTPKKTTR